MSQNDPPIVVPPAGVIPPADWISYRSPSPPPSAPPSSGSFRRFIIDYNPFFLLSALCMLGGCLALTNSLSWSPVRLQRILLLTATINAYELILVGLGLFLIRRRGARRDGAILLILEAFFLVDVAFLNAELFAIDRWVGLAANLLLLTLALGKLAVIFRTIGGAIISLPSLTIAAQVVVLFALPGALKFYATARGGTLPPIAMLAVWWTLFAVGAGATLVHEHARRARATPIAPWFAPLLTVVAFVSLLAHAGTSQWVYDLRYWGADLAPVLALAAFVLCYRPATQVPGILCAIAAVLASTSHNHTLRVDFNGHLLSPVHLTAGVVYLALAWTLARSIFLWLAGVGFTAALVVVFGPTLATVRTTTSGVMERLVGMLDSVRPRTQTHWGIIAVTLSFLFLAIGALVSLRRRDEPESA